MVALLPTNCLSPRQSTIQAEECIDLVTFMKQRLCQRSVHRNPPSQIHVIEIRHSSANRSSIASRRSRRSRHFADISAVGSECDLAADYGQFRPNYQSVRIRPLLTCHQISEEWSNVGDEVKSSSPRLRIRKLGCVVHFGTVFDERKMKRLLIIRT